MPKKKGSSLEKAAEQHNLQLSVIYTYDLKQQLKSKAVRFVYLLKGRGKEPGIIREFKGKFLAPGCFMMSAKKDKEIQEIFKLWKIPFKRKEILTQD